MGMTKEHIERALNEVCFGSAEQFPLEETVARYFAPDYTQLTDGVPADYDEFVAHIRMLRSRCTGGRITVERWVCDGAAFADRHTATITKADGSTLTSEVYLFGEVDADGRLRHVEELTRMVEGGDAADADLAHAR
jgi:hypothetical protein